MGDGQNIRVPIKAFNPALNHRVLMDQRQKVFVRSAVDRRKGVYDRRNEDRVPVRDRRK